MAIRSFTLTTAAGLGLLLALQADAGQANVSLATGSAATTATTASVTEAATTAAASIVLEAQTPPPAAAPAPAPEEPAPSVTGGVNVDLFSHYVWRGFALTDGFAFQPSVFVSTNGLTFTSWSSWSSTDAGCFNADDCPALREHDFTVDFTKPVGTATVSVGYINYLFPPYRTDEAKAADAVGVTNELYAGVTFTAPAQPVREGLLRRRRRRTTATPRRAPTCSSASASRSRWPRARRRSRRCSRSPTTSSQWITEDDWNDANLGVKLAIPAGKFTITPAMYLSIGLNDTVKAIGYGDGDTKFYGGVGFSYAF